MKHYQNSRQKGATLGLVIACAAILVIVLVGASQLYLLFNGSQDARNAIDAGVLNLATKAVTVGVAPGEFSDCADSSGTITLTNVNRVWGKALLVNANVAAMTTDGQSTGPASDSAASSFNAAQYVNDALYDKVTSNAMGNYVVQMSSQHGSAGHAGKSDQANQDKQPTKVLTAAVYRGDQSNIQFGANQIPGGANLSAGGQFIPGYRPLNCNDRNFYMLAFRSDDMPHLIDNSLFQSGVAPVSSVKNALPNAFAASGSVEENGTLINASAAAAANPQRQYKLAIPHAYVAINLMPNQANWYKKDLSLKIPDTDFVKVNQTNYKFKVDKAWGIKNLKSNKKEMNGYASLGNEYSDATLWQALNALPADHEPILRRILQRIQEIKSDYTKGQLKTLLASQQIDQDSEEAQQFVIYPMYELPDNTDPTIHIAKLTDVKAAWFINNSAEGSAKVVVTEEAKDKPNYSWAMFVKGNGSESHTTKMKGSIGWAPGSGHKQCLGDVSIFRQTNVYFTINP